MLEMKRRRFLGITAATVAVAAVPVATVYGPNLARASQSKPALGTVFHVGVWVDAKSPGLAAFVTAPDRTTALRRVEIERGVRLSLAKIDVAWHGDRAAWFVASLAKVIGYA